MRLVHEILSQARKFLFSRELLPTLDTRREAVRRAAGDTRTEARKLIVLQPLLGQLADAFDAYRANLDQSLGGATAPGALGNVWGLASNRVNGVDTPATQIREVAQLTLQEHPFALSDRIYRLSGELSQAARGN